MKKYLLLLPLVFLMSIHSLVAQNKHGLRPPAYPLVTVDPYFSIWSFQDTLYNGPTRHWTGTEQSLQGIIRVDGKTKYFMGQPIATYHTILPMADKKGEWQYSFSNPGKGWKEDREQKNVWERTRGAFSDADNAPNRWNSKDIWVRRTFDIDDLNRINPDNLMLKIHHDDNVKVYINGVPAFEKEGWVSKPAIVKISKEAKKALKEGPNTLAIHCRNTAGGAYLDAGLVEKQEPGVHLATARQTNVNVTATQTSYQFKAGPVLLKAIFTAPLLPDSLGLISRPANYLTFKVHSTDSQSHDVQVYLSAASNMVVNSDDQPVVWQRMASRDLDIMRMGTADQHILGRKGDNVRIDWGYLYMAIGSGQGEISQITDSRTSVKSFAETGAVGHSDELQMPQSPAQESVTLATSFDLGSVGKKPKQRHAILAYDDLYSVEYFHQPLQAWWKKDGQSVIAMLKQSQKQYKQLMRAADKFDNRLHAKAKSSGGEKYARLTELAYRQSIAAHKLVTAPNGKPLFLSKENFSNGSIGTVDITYPSAPLFLYYNPELLKGMLRPIFYYTESGRWTKPFAAHDVGTYPIANGQTYGEDMPVEEAGNMLILAAAIAEADGNAQFAQTHWKALSTWAGYLQDNGLDPKNQLSTDDFAGHLAHNANLSIKAILGIAGYGKLAGMLGKDNIAKKYTNAAKGMAQKWMKMADAGDHYELAFGKPDTWSQKYNLAWDDVLGLNIFPDRVNKTEIAYYLKHQNTYGLPLDNRATYTKSDWIMWTATLANDRSTFEQFIDPEYKAFNETEDRVPMTDWYQTTDASQVGFQARSVVGGYFMKMLESKFKDNR